MTGSSTEVKIAQIEGDIKSLRTEITHSAASTKTELSHVRSSVEEIGEAVKALVTMSQETALLRKEVNYALDRTSDLEQKMEKRNQTTDPLIKEAQDFLASFKAGFAVALKTLGVLQIVFIGWLSVNETRYQELTIKVQELRVDLTRIEAHRVR